MYCSAWIFQLWDAAQSANVAVFDMNEAAAEYRKTSLERSADVDCGEAVSRGRGASVACSTGCLVGEGCVRPDFEMPGYLTWTARSGAASLARMASPESAWAVIRRAKLT